MFDLGVQVGKTKKIQPMLFSSFALVVGGIVNLLPLSGLLGSAQLEMLYGIPIKDDNLLVLMRHRAVLFGLTGSFMLYSGLWRPAWKQLAHVAGLSSMLSFVLIAKMSKGALDRFIGRVVTVDIVASVLLITSLLLE